MSFQTPITVKEVVENIHKKRYLLPAIQREVVWDVEQIERLFDSLLRDYPIGSFLFWRVEKQNTGKFQFYEFMRNFHERKATHNPKANVSGDDEVIAVLDGQQRFTALYLGLKGSYAYKEPRKRWDNPEAFPKRQLYLNLLSRCTDEQNDLLYDFRFLTDDQAEKQDDDTYWYLVGDILGVADLASVNEYLMDNDLMAGRPKEKSKFANKTLHKLWQVVHESCVINFFEERDESLDKVLNIFIRVNSGGTILSYSDLLLSIATAQWKSRDAREEITGFVDDLNATGDGFNFDKDFVMKSTLVLSDVADVKFKVDNFNKANMGTIETMWDEITGALRLAVTLVESFGYSRDTLTANYAIIPIAYYLRRIGIPKNYVLAKEFNDDRALIRRWLVASLVKRVFGGIPDTVLRGIREVLRTSKDAFPLDRISERFKGTPKSLIFSDDDIENLLQHRYGQGYTFSTLSLLYPHFDYRNKFHIDHMHPRSHFRKSLLVKQGVNPGDTDEFIERCDLLPNLQLLEGIPNQQKNDTPFADWMDSVYPKGAKRQNYMSTHLVPDCSFRLRDFDKFYEERQELLRDALTASLIDGKK